MTGPMRSRHWDDSHAGMLSDMTSDHRPEPFLIIRSVPVPTALSVVPELALNVERERAGGAPVGHQLPAPALVAAITVRAHEVRILTP